MIVTKVLGIFIIIFVGYAANKLGWLPAESSKYLSKIVINIASPCLLIVAMAGKEKNPETIKTIGILFVVALVGYAIAWLISVGFCKILKISRFDSGVYKNFLIFSNNGFMGFPLALAIFGEEGMFFMVIMFSLSPLFVYSLGIVTIKRSAGQMGNGEKFQFSKMIKNMITLPLVATIVGLVIYFCEIPIQEEVYNTLNSIGAMMTPLCMIVIGIQLTESKIKDVIFNKNLLLMSLVRLAILPIIFYLITLPFGFSNLITGIIVLNFLLPAAAVPVIIAEEFGGNAKLAAEGTFLSTLLSLVTVPIATILLGMLY